MNILSFIEQLFTSEVFAVYIVGILSIIVALRQFRQNYRGTKKATVFDELSKSVRSARELMSSVNNDTDTLITKLANAADAVSNYDRATELTNNEQEIERRLTDLNETTDMHLKLLTTIRDSSLSILKLIENIEKSTLIKEKTRMSARYLFYEAADQDALVNAAISILRSFNVTPPPGDKLNITPETFRACVELIRLINERNIVIENYLNDLEVILHNDLVKTIYGKANFNPIRTRHLRSDGLVDERVKQRLI